MLKMARIAYVSALAVLALGATGLLTSSARALTTDDKPAALLVWPKIIVDTSGVFTTPSGTLTDTLIQLTNTGSKAQLAHCFYVNANSHCAAPANTTTVCRTSADCEFSGGIAPCVPGWNEIDFDIILTPQQPVAWHASAGLTNSQLPLSSGGVCDIPIGQPCSSNLQCTAPNGVCQFPGSNLGTGVPPTPEDPFIGSLTCLEFTAGSSSSVDVSSNTLIGNGTIESLLGGSAGAPDIQIYNAVGLLGTGTPPPQPGNSLQIGGVPPSSGPPSYQYQACPTTLILDHAFDIPSVTTTDLTLVPCGNDFLTQQPGEVTAQFLVFNEFEQRFSTSHPVDCFFESPLSAIDTTNPLRSIFSITVSGTVTGQTRIRPVGSASTGRGLVGVARNLTDVHGAAYNLFQSGTPDFTTTPPDVITIP